VKFLTKRGNRTYVAVLPTEMAKAAE